MKIFKLYIYSLLLIMLSSCVSEVNVQTNASRTQTVSSISTTNHIVTESDTDVDSNITISLSTPVTENVSLTISPSTDYKAIEGTDFTVNTASVDLTKGQTSFDISITIKGDLEGEGTESFSLNLTSSDSTILPSSAITISISDNDPIILTVNPFYPTNGTNWNDYVVQASTSIKKDEYNDVACTGFSRHYTCINGGEVRKVIATGERSCDQLTMEDQLGVFRWKCSESEDPVYFYSYEFQKGKGLRNLVSAASFNSNKVTLKKNGSTLWESPLSNSWWGNTVQPVTLNSGPGDPRQSLNTSGTIYTITASGESRGIDLEATKVSLVTLPGVTISATSTLAGATTLIYVSGGSSFNWVEANLIGSAGAANTIYIDGGSIEILGTTINNLSIQGNGSNIGIGGWDNRGTRVMGANISGMTDGAIYGVSLTNFRASLVKDSILHNSSNGLSLRGWYLNLQNLQVSDNSNYGVSLTAWNVWMNKIKAFNNGVGLHFEGETIIGSEMYVFGNTTGVEIINNSGYILNSTILSNINDGINVASISALEQYYVGNSLIVNNQTGINSSTLNGEFSNNLIAHNFVGINLAAGAEDSNFYNKLLLGTNITNCVVDGGLTNPGVTGADCDNQGPSTATRTLGFDVYNSLTGLVATDSANADPVQTTYASITDWSNYENFTRAWANLDLALNSFPLPGRCVSGDTCGIWDLAPVPTETNIINKNGALTDQATCPAAVHGDKTKVFYFSTALINAVEVMGDEIGNDNTLCESNETCIYSANIGAYQGEGEPTKSCVFQDGTVSGVTMLGY